MSSRRGLWPTFKTGTHTMSRFTGWVAAVVMGCMMLLTAADIIARLLKLPIEAAHDVTELMMVVIIFLGLPLTSSLGGQVKVELLTSKLSHRKNASIDVFTSFLCILVCIGIIWGLIRRTFQSIAGNWGTPTIFFPVYPFVIVAIIGCLLLILVMVIQWQELLKRAVGK
jgi:TRAP-type transport system small permease protein